MCAKVQSPELITQLSDRTSQLTAHSSLAYLIMSTMSRPDCRAPHPYSDVGWLGGLQEDLRIAIDKYQRGRDMEVQGQTADLYHLRLMLVYAYDDMRGAWDCCVCPATIHDKVLDTIEEAEFILDTSQPARPPSPGYTEPVRDDVFDGAPEGTTSITMVGGIALYSDSPTPGGTPEPTDDDDLDDVPVVVFDDEPDRPKLRRTSRKAVPNPRYGPQAWHK